MNMTIIAMITLATVATLVFGYWGLVQVCNGSTTTGGIAIVLSLLPGMAAFKIAQYRNELVDR